MLLLLTPRQVRRVPPSSHARSGELEQALIWPRLTSDFVFVRRQELRRFAPDNESGIPDLWSGVA